MWLAGASSRAAQVTVVCAAQLPPMEFARGGHSTAVVNSNIYVLGGTGRKTHDGHSDILHSVELADTERAQWMQVSAVAAPASLDAADPAESTSLPACVRVCMSALSTGGGAGSTQQCGAVQMCLLRRKTAGQTAARAHTTPCTAAWAARLCWHLWRQTCCTTDSRTLQTSRLKLPRMSAAARWPRAPSSWWGGHNTEHYLDSCERYDPRTPKWHMVCAAWHACPPATRQAVTQSCEGQHRPCSLPDLLWSSWQQVRRIWRFTAPRAQHLGPRASLSCGAVVPAPPHRQDGMDVWAVAASHRVGPG